MTSFKIVVEQAKLIEGEDEELQEEFRRLSNSRSITENLSEVYQSIAGDGDCVSAFRISERFLHFCSSSFSVEYSFCFNCSIYSS